MENVALEKRQASSGDNSWKLESSGMVRVWGGGGGEVGYVCGSVARCVIIYFVSLFGFAQYHYPTSFQELFHHLLCVYVTKWMDVFCVSLVEGIECALEADDT